MLEPAGLGADFETLNRRAVQIALEARERADCGEGVAIAGSMSHQVPVEIGSDRRRTDAVVAQSREPSRYREMAELLVDGGVDLILMEMMSDPELANPAIAAAIGTGVPVWVGFSVRRHESGGLRAYSRPELEAAQMLDAIALDGVDVAGIMHTGAESTGPAIELLKARWPGPMMAYPDSGYFRMPQWQFEDVIEAADLVEHARHWVSDGVQVLGGCCGLGVEHIDAMVRAL